MAENESNKESGISIVSMITRVLLTSLVVGLAAFFTPGFSISGLGSLIIAAIVIVVLNFLVEKLTGIDASPFGRGLVGFLIAGSILYVTKFLVTGFNISILGAILGALAVGIIDVIVPGKVI